jgi:hypothetical protein
MFTVVWAVSLLVKPALYVMTMIVLWACLPQRVLRVSIVLVMAIVPIGFGVSAVRDAWLLSDAKQSFRELCRAAVPPSVHSRVTSVESIFVNVQPIKHNTPQAERHPHLVFPQEEATRYLLNGAQRYPRIERIANWGPYQSVDRRNISRPGQGSIWTSRYAIEWQSLEVRSGFVTTGILVVRQVDGGRILAEQRTHHFGSPPVTLIGQSDAGLRLADGNSIACPSTRQIADFVKSVAQPSNIPEK